MRVDDGRVVSNFLDQAQRGLPITLYGDGSQTRSFCYVDDLIQAFISYVNLEQDFAGPVNLGNPNEISIKELAELIIKITDSKSELRYLALPGDDPKQRKPDIELAKTMLGWEPSISLEEGILRILEKK